MKHIKNNPPQRNFKKNSAPIRPVSQASFTNGTQLDADGKIHNQVNLGQEVKQAIKEKIQLGSQTIGGAFGKVGKSFRKNGYYKVATRIEKMGNKIEHIAD